MELQKNKVILIWSIFNLAICIMLIILQAIQPISPPTILGVGDVYCILGENKPNLLEKIVALDSRGRDISSKIVVEESAVLWDKSGTYAISYSVKDRYSKKSVESASLVIVPSYPYFEGLDKVYCLMGQSVDFSNIKAFDGFGQPVKEVIVSSYKSDVLGVQTVIFKAVDNYGFEKLAEIDLHVIESYLPIFSGIDYIEYTIGFGWVNLFETISASSYKGINISERIIIDDALVKYKTPGEYIVYLTVNDEENNKKTQEISVVVREIGEEFYPRIIGVREKLVLEIGSPKPDWLEGISANDENDGDLTNFVQVDSSKININQIGEYRVYYSVENSLGLAFEDFIIVQIVAPNVDITAPIITGVETVLEYFIPEDPNSVEISISFYLDGVEAEDDFDGDITHTIVVDDSNVNYQIPGIYIVNYFVEDKAENSCERTREVVVIDNIPPKFYGIVQEWEIIVGSSEPSYFDGVTARDNVDGDITDRIYTIFDDSINYSVVGEYSFFFIVYDSANNQAVEEVFVRIVEN